MLGSQEIEAASAGQFMSPGAASMDWRKTEWRMLASVLGREHIHITLQKVPEALSHMHPQQKSTFSVRLINFSLFPVSLFHLCLLVV